MKNKQIMEVVKMIKSYEPKSINLFWDCFMGSLPIILLSIIGFIYPSKLFYIIIFVMLLIINVLVLIIALGRYNTVFFNGKKLIITNGLFKKNQEIIYYKSIDKLCSTIEGGRFLASILTLTSDYILLKYKENKKVSYIKIHQSFFSNEEFRQIHLEFMKRIPSYKINFDKNYYNL